MFFRVTGKSDRGSKRGRDIRKDEENALICFRCFRRKSHPDDEGIPSTIRFRGMPHCLSAFSREQSDSKTAACPPSNQEGVMTDPSPLKAILLLLKQADSLAITAGRKTFFPSGFLSGMSCPPKHIRKLSKPFFCANRPSHFFLTGNLPFPGIDPDKRTSE